MTILQLGFLRRLEQLGSISAVAKCHVCRSVIRKGWAKVEAGKVVITEKGKAAWRRSPSG